MRVFVTGATGFVGSAVVQELIGAGHEVLGLVRSDASAEALAAAGGTVLRGDLKDLDSLRSGAEQADGVIHTGFIHDFQNFADCCAVDRAAVTAMGEALVGSGKPFIVTSGTGLMVQGQINAETDPVPSEGMGALRGATEGVALGFAARGVRAQIMRLPNSVHGAGDHGFVPILIGMAKAAGRSAYIDGGMNHWPAVARQDAARAYVLALEKGAAGACHHPVAEMGLLFREVAEAIGRGLGLETVSVPRETAETHFSWFTHFALMNAPASSQITRQALGWAPKGPGLIAEMDAGVYF